MNVRSWVGSVLLTAVVASMNAVGCSHDIESPPASASSPVTPDLACVAQLTTPVTLKGTGFTPMSHQTLAGGEQLFLPTITLKRDVDLDNQPQSDTVTVPDNPANPTDPTNHVRWTSETEMSFDVFPGEDPANSADSGNLPTGLYDITVTNPDGHTTASFAQSLGAVPPPSITKIVPPAMCDDQADQTMEIDGANFLKVGAQLPTVTVGGKTFTASAVTNCKPMPGTYVEGDVELCSTLTFVIPQGTFQPGDYNVTVTNPPPANCVSSETIVLHDEPPPVVTKVTGKVCEGGGTLVVDGSGYIDTPSVSLEAQNQPTVSSSSVSITQGTSPDGTELSAKIPGGLTVGQSYDVVVTNPDGCSDVPPHQQVTVQAGPVIYWADPGVVYNGVNMVVTVYMTAAFNAVNDTVTMTPTGQSAPVTNLTPSAVPGHANRFTVTIPVNQAPGVYDLTLTDSTGCSAILTQAITVTHDLSIAIKDVVPPFGWTSSSTDVTIYRDTAAAAPLNVPFKATPRAYLNNATSTAATPLTAVDFVDQDTLTAVVPKGLAVGKYDLIVTNPDGTVGFLPNAFEVTTDAPPVISNLVPQSIIDQTGQSLTVDGTDFRTGATVSVSCKDSANLSYTPGVTQGTVNAAGTSVTVTVDGSSLSGATGQVVCVVRLTNTDGTYFDYSAMGVTNSSLNLNKPAVAGTKLTVARRALVSSAINATNAARFIYAIGGDSGSAGDASPFDTTEFASVDLYGKMGAWSKQTYNLPTGRSFAASTKLGRYTYVLGGTSDNTANGSTLKSAIRAMTLSPTEAPVADVSDVYLCPGDASCKGGPGLGGGFWYYRVSAVFAASDLDNPGGESLASDELPLKLPTFPGKNLDVVLAWSAPVDSLGVPLPNVVGYNIYRTTAVDGTPGTEVLLASVGAVTTYVDDASAAPGTQTPLPLGSMGQWAPLPDMGTARKGLGATLAPDPTLPNTYYAYALLGMDGTGAVSTTYEDLAITVLPNGHQTVGAWKPGASGVAANEARWLLGGWSVDSSVLSGVTGTYVYLGGGMNAAASAPVVNVNVGQVATGGDLGTLGTATSFSNSTGGGYGTLAAVGQLFAIGGKSTSPTVSASGESSTITNGTPPTLANWQSEANLLDSPRYLFGCTVQSAFIFLVGGDPGGGTATNTTSAIIW